LASLKGMDRRPVEEKADELLEKTGMLSTKRQKIEEMSKGMGQIIQFIVTVIHDPKLIIMDEPFSGLDPVNTEIIKNIIRKLRDDGKTIILSTHQMNQVEELCDNVLMINKGHAVLYGDVNETKAGFTKNSVRIVIDGELKNLNGITNIKHNKEYIELELETGITPQNILDQIRKDGINIKRFEVSTPSLHEIFLTKASES
ncbi:MAG: DUF4162 domain-containing protein, partial [Mariniphaga sp.]|nr:DUF4162 domain-containing protein [Mariniphaga sp.]